MKFDINLADFFKLPTKIILAIALASGMILFLPDSIVLKMYMVDFKNHYGFAIGIVFLISSSILLVTILISSYEYAHQKYMIRKFKATAHERLSKLNDYQKNIIYGLYIKDNYTNELPLHDGAVQSLEENMIIRRTANQYAASDFNHAVFPYMLLPWAVEELDKDENLLSDFQTAFNQMEAKYAEAERQCYDPYSEIPFRY